MFTMILALIAAPSATDWALRATTPAYQAEQPRRWQRGGDRPRRFGGRRGTGGADAESRARSRPDQTISYGSDAAQAILFYAPQSSGPRAAQRPPLAVYVHGGGWAHGAPQMVDAKAEWFGGQGWAFASIGYRLLPGAPVEDQARDVGAALRQLRSDAARLGYDPDRILLLGHSAGAHLTALVAADPSYAGEAFEAIRGTILIDGACYDVPAQIAASPFMARRTYIPAFGNDPARQRALSPITHVGGQDARDWLLLYTGARGDAQAQSRALAAALDRNAVRTQLFEVPSDERQLQGHMAINRDFGTAGYAATDAVLAIMRRVAGQ
jgi:arylformamidase